MAQTDDIQDYDDARLVHQLDNYMDTRDLVAVFTGSLDTAYDWYRSGNDQVLTDHKHAKRVRYRVLNIPAVSHKVLVYGYAEDFIDGGWNYVLFDKGTPTSEITGELRTMFRTDLDDRQAARGEVEATTEDKVQLKLAELNRTIMELKLENKMLRELAGVSDTDLDRTHLEHEEWSRGRITITREGTKVELRLNNAVKRLDGETILQAIENYDQQVARSTATFARITEQTGIRA